MVKLYRQPGMQLSLMAHSLHDIFVISLIKTLRTTSIRKKKIEKGKLQVLRLDFFLVYDFAESFPAALIKRYCKLRSFSFLIWFASHFPSFCWIFSFFSTSWAFCHDYPYLECYHMNQHKKFAVNARKKVNKAFFWG